MKHTTLLATLALCLATLGCASKPQPRYTAPSVVAVKTSLERLKPHVASPAGVAAISDLSQAVDTYEAQVGQQSIALAKAQEDAVYWQNKHSASLRKLWFWRGLAALTLASLAGWLALRMGVRLMIP
jgi:hypothetical protein